MPRFWRVRTYMRLPVATRHGSRCHAPPPVESTPDGTRSRASERPKNPLLAEGLAMRSAGQPSRRWRPHRGPTFPSPPRSPMRSGPSSGPERPKGTHCRLARPGSGRSARRSRREGLASPSTSRGSTHPRARVVGRLSGARCSFFPEAGMIISSVARGLGAPQAQGRGRPSTSQCAARGGRLPRTGPTVKAQRRSPASRLRGDVRPQVPVRFSVKHHQPAWAPWIRRSGGRCSSRAGSPGTR